MTFLCPAYGDERTWNALPRSTQEALRAQSFSQSPLPLAGFHVLEARDIDEAIALLSRTPCAHAGAYELRPLA